MATQRSTHSTKGKKTSAKKPAAKASAKMSQPKVKTAVKATHKEVERRSEAKRRTDTRPGQEDRRQTHAPAGAHATGPADFVITRKWTGKTLDSKVGAHVRVELPESTLRGMAWQLQKLPHGVELASANVEHLAKPEGQMNQNRVFDFALTEEGEYLLQFQLQRPFAQSGVADTFKVKLHAKN